MEETVEFIKKFAIENWLEVNVVSNWIETNVISNINELVSELFADEKIAPDDFENYWERPNLENYDTKKEYDEAIANPEPQEVYEWYCVTQSGYNFFKMCGDPVAIYKGVYIWGRTSTGQKIIVDFTNDKHRMILSDKFINTN